MSKIGWQKRILFWPVHELSAGIGNPEGVLLQIHAGAEWRGRTKESDNGRSGQGNARGEEHAAMLEEKSNPEARLYSESDLCSRRDGVAT